ncbi:hypothetical protein HYH02_009303 [Chlamydomonas schloesseri]|uniref:Uncharacterized protein n=1 Tax=Chlamydomonas schloesseri TaxID=2026947 RepID=A0A835W883_9CHLO|nr:hypothetical protein HYH02_009303 [Chlamydomonas schloesseri]|eukprot:KAG2443230.1 hypothetical protein HYH02_009303 [Chlamydomonas schloesseri]
MHCSLTARCAVAEAKLAALQAAAGLAAVLARDGRLTPAPGSPGAAAALLDPPPAPSAASAAEPSTPGPGRGSAAGGGAGGGGVLATAAAVSAAAVGALLHWCSSPEARAASQAPDWGLRRLHAQRLAAAMSASRLLLAAVQAARPALLGAPAGAPATAAGGGGGGGFATPARTPGLGLGLGGVFGTPQTRRHHGHGHSGGGSTAAASGGAAADAAFLPLVVSLARQVAGWARVVAAAGLPQCPAVVVGQVTDSLAGALLLTLQMLPAAGADGGAGAGPGGALESEAAAAADRQQLSAALLSVLPQLCELAAAGGVSPPLAAQLVLESTRHLATHEWLPPLMAHIDLGRHVLEAAGRAAAIAAGGAAAVTAAAAAAGGQSAAVAALLALRGGDAAAAAGDVGMLALALAVAQVPEGAQALHERGILDQVVAAGRHLLSSGGGRLAAFSVIAVTGTGPYRPGVDGTYASTSGAAAAGTLMGAAAADTCGAYLVPAAAADGGGGGGVWSPVHRQWCTLLQFSSALLRTLGQYVDVEREALDLLLALEPRLLLAVLPPGGDCLQPLTLAGLVELEAALFLLGQLAPYLGGWHLVLPASLVNFRTALSTLLTWLAAPSLSRAFAVDCRPRAPREAALAALPAAGMPAAEGWFRVATAGAAAPPAGGAATFAFAAAAAAAGGAGAGGGTPGGGGGTSNGGAMGSPIAGVALGSPSLRFSMSRGMSDTLGSLITPSTPPAGAGGGGGGFATPLPAGRAASGLGAAAATPGGGGAASGRISDSNPPVGGGGAAAPTCSEYSAQVAEKLYACAHHALSFLAASSPQLSEGEAASLGPAWPRPRDLSALLEQCRAAAESLTNYQPSAAVGDDGGGGALPSTPSLVGGGASVGGAGGGSGGGAGGGGGGGAGAARRAAAVRTLSRVGQMCAQFLSVLGQAAPPHAQPPLPGAGAAHHAHVHHHNHHSHFHHLHAGLLGQREAAAQEWLASLELSGGVLGGGGGGGGFGSLGSTPAVPAT